MGRSAAAWRGCVTLACLLAGASCSHRPVGQDRRDITITPEDIADFKELVAEYNAAGELSRSRCADYAKRFTAVYEHHGSGATVAWFNAGVVWEKCGDLDKAVKVYKAITVAEPKFDLAYNNLGVIYWNRHKEQEALRYFKLAVDANPATVAPRNNLAAALRDKYATTPQDAAFVEAEQHLQNVLAVDSTNRNAYENLARLYYDRGRLQDKSYLLLAELVVTQANRILGDEGDQSADLQNLHGLLLMERGNQVDALRAFKRAVELEPRHPDAHMNIAMIALRFRDYEQAETSISVALDDRRQRSNVEAYLGLGVAKRGLRKYEAAQKAFERAIKVDRADARALYNLGVLHQEHLAPAKIEQDGGKSDNEIAKAYFEKFVAAAKPELEESVADARKRMKSIDEYIVALEEADKLQREADRIAAQAAAEEKERREQLLNMEKRAMEAAQNSH